MAGKIRDEDIALVRDKTSIVDVISESVTLRSAGGGNLKGICPFHDEKTPSFNVSAARNVFYGGSALFFAIFLALTAHSHYHMVTTSTDE